MHWASGVPLIYSKALLRHLLLRFIIFSSFPLSQRECIPVTSLEKRECNKCFLSTGPRLFSIGLTRFLFNCCISWSGQWPMFSTCISAPRGSLPQMCIPASLPKCQLQEPNVPTVSQSFDFMIYYPLTLPLDNNRRLFTGHPWDDSGLTHWAARHNLQPGPPVPTDIWRGVFTLSQHFSQWGVHTALVPARRAVCVHNQERESSLGGRHKLWPQQDLPEQCMHVLRWSHEA